MAASGPREPVARHQVVVQARLEAARLGRVAVFPAHQRWQAHQDRLGAAAALQPEVGASVVDQVELDVAAAPVQLELALPLAPGRVLAAFDDRQVGIEETVADRAQIAEILFEVPLQVVEEQAADATRLVAVPEVEVFVAPALMRLVTLLPAERLAQRACCAMPVLHVLVDRIERSQVEAAAEPPGHGLAIAL